MKGSLCLSWGKWGGFYWHKGYSFRICLGWVAITWFPDEIDDLIHFVRQKNNESTHQH